MKRCGIEIGTIWPNQGPRLFVESYAIEERFVSKRAEDFTNEDGPKVDDLSHAVFKADPEREGTYLLETGDGVNLMDHVLYLRGSILAASCPACKATQLFRSSG